MAERVLHRIAGARASRLHRRLRVGSLAALGAALATALFLALRPLPAPESEPVATPGEAPGLAPGGSDLGERERRLTALGAAGNVFAADRRPWPEEPVETETAAAQEPAAPERPAERSAPSGEPPAVEAIRLTERPTAAASQSLEQLSLRGVLVSGGRRLVMIQGGVPRQRTDVELYREGDVFLKETWRVVRIDAVGDRVILEHLGQGDVLALSMYDSAFAARPEAAREGETSVAGATEFEARRELLDAGVERDDVDEVFEMMARLERGEDVTVEPDEEEPAEAVAASPEEPAADEAEREAREMPPGLAELLKSMMQDAARSRAKKPDETASEDETESSDR